MFTLLPRNPADEPGGFPREWKWLGLQWWLLRPVRETPSGFKAVEKLPVGEIVPSAADLLCSPGLQSGGAGFQTRGNVRYINFGALAMVAASQAVCDFSRSL